MKQGEQRLTIPMALLFSLVSHYRVGILAVGFFLNLELVWRQIKVEGRGTSARFCWSPKSERRAIAHVPTTMVGSNRFATLQPLTGFLTRFSWSVIGYMDSITVLFNSVLMACIWVWWLFFNFTRDYGSCGLVWLDFYIC